MLIKKIPDTSGLVATNVLKTKISEVKNKIPNTSILVSTTVLNTKISEVENKILDNFKYITTQEFNKSTEENVAARLKQADLVNEGDFDIKLINFNKPITSNKTKHLEVEKKLNSPITKYYNFFFGITYFGSNDGSRNTFLYYTTLNTLELKKAKSSDYVLCWKSKWAFNFKLMPLYTALLSSIKLGIETKFDKDPLAVEQNNYMRAKL